MPTAPERANVWIVPPLIISASRRTDVPAFFTPWWMYRVRGGRVLVRNPRNPNHVIEVSLRPEDVIAVVYWSRDYGRLLPNLPELDDRGLLPCFHMTLTGYGRPLELRGPDVDTAVAQLELLAARYGPSRTVWRYDPIVLGSRHHEGFHEENFAALARRIAPLVRSCIISFLDPYPSTRRALAALETARIERFETPSLEQRRHLAARLVEVGKAWNLSVHACCEADVTDVVGPARCIDPDWIATFAPIPKGSIRMLPTRKGCGCAFARDIGAYHTCAHGCVYCYANESPEMGLRNARTVEPHACHLGAGPLAVQPPVPKKPADSAQLDLGNLTVGTAHDDEKTR